jgi:hypothetical protein
MRRGSAAVFLAGAATVVDVSRGARAESPPDHNSVIPAAMADSGSRPNLSGLPPSPPAELFRPPRCRGRWPHIAAQPACHVYDRARPAKAFTSTRPSCLSTKVLRPR